ncbi:hypothetical protein BDW59DRAFT_141781 [Aspergillus cavernicola]|uniref:NB-ARC domain-containing protein n=1 Tax=Aspergillus cavernicola TaxID=176166 RepID=A0ABR4IR09_9EURO
MDPVSRIRQFGLTLIYESPDPLVDIVLVHGLNGHPHRTWASKSTNTFWPIDLLPDVVSQNRVRILTYGYNANVTSFTDGASKDRILNHSETLAAQLAANRTLKRCPERPIIFVCHSLGGLVVKRALIYSRSITNEKVEHLRSIYVSTYGILFLGTPHNGSEVAKWGLLLQNICSAVLPKKVMESSSQLIKALKTNNETLQNINSLFADMLPRFHIYFFHETLSTDVKGSRELIVDENSAAPYADGVERMGIEADHSHMCKFDDENAPGYEAVAEALLRYSRDAPATIQERWDEEEKTRMIVRTQKAKEIFGDVTFNDASTPDRHDRSLADETALVNLPVQSYLPPLDKTSPGSVAGSTTDLSLSRSWQRELLLVVPSGFHRNATFFGMKKELEILHARLFKAKKRAENLMAVLICGVPGSGKSHLARQYVWTHRDDYPGGIFWVDAKSRQSTYKCFWDIAQAATLTDGQEFQSPDTKSSSKYVDAVRHWLQSRQEWLLVFDGVNFGHDEDINMFKQFLPFRERCSIIYTSVDKTLRKKQRLYEPYCLLVSPLQIEDACKFLFKDLGIKRPTKAQVRKATEVVTHYECLPLAIHAISHRLSATDKPIEKYHINSHLTDEKLAEPFLSIMHDLYRGEHFAALNLINLLSFLGHHVPVGLITLGKSFLEAWNIAVFTSSRHGERGDLDTTLGILIRYGLIERTSDKYPLLQTPSPLSEKYPVDMKAVIPDFSESQTESSQEGFFTAYQSSGVSDTIKIHSVVQGFCRDELRTMDKDLKGTGNSGTGSQNAGFYDSWLVVATRVFCTSFENAKCRMDRVDDCGSVKDYREYETHASQLLKNYPKRTAYAIVDDTLRQLKEALKTIRSEIDRVSPNSSQESIRKHRSVFDRSSSSSSFPDSTASDGPSRQLTLDFSDVVPRRSESPQKDRMSPHQVNLSPIVPHIFRHSHEEEASGDDRYLKVDGYSKDNGYMTDDESERAVRESPSMSQISQTTERPRVISPPQIDEGWHVVENPSKNRPLLRPRLPKRRSRVPRSIGDYKSAEKTPAWRSVSKPAVPLLERTTAWSVANGTMSEQKGSPHRTASEALSAVSKGSPPQLPPPPPLHEQRKENAPTYAYIVSKLAQDKVPSSNQRSSSSPGNRTRPKFSPMPSASSESLIHSTYSEPDYGLMQQLEALDLRAAPSGDTGRRRGPPVDLSASTPTLGLPYESNIEIKVARHRKSTPMPAFSSKSSTNISSIPHPSAIMPGASPPSSDPAPELMSRNPSGQSQQSWSTDPAQWPSSDLQPNQVYHIIPQQHVLSGTGSWVSDKQPTQHQYHPQHQDTSYAAVAQKRYIPQQDVVLDDSIWNPSSAPGPTLHFGAHRVDLQSARQRQQSASRSHQYHSPQAQMQTQTPQYHIYHDNRSGPLFTTHEGIWPVQEATRRRARSGSSPSRSGVGVGLGFRG